MLRLIIWVERWQVKRLKSFMAYAFTIISDILFFIIHGYMFIKRILYYSCFGLVWYSHLTMKEERRDGRKLISHFGNICMEPQLVIATNICYHLSQIFLYHCKINSLLWQWFWQLKVSRYWRSQIYELKNIKIDVVMY